MGLGRLQNEDHKSVAELAAKGAGPEKLLNDTKIFVTANGILKTFEQAIIDGDIGAGGNVKISFETVTPGAFQTTVTLVNLTYDFAKNSHWFYRNGVKIDTLLGSGDPFSSDSEIAFSEYKEVDNGENSTQIILNPLAATEAKTKIHFVKFQNTFDGNGIGDKIRTTSEGRPDNTFLTNATMSTVAFKTRMALTTWTYTPDLFLSEVHGDICAWANGNEISRRRIGVNDVPPVGETTILYEEDTTNGAFVDFFEIDDVGTITPINDDVILKAERVKVQAADLDAIEGPLVAPAVAGAVDLGNPVFPFGNLQVNTINGQPVGSGGGAGGGGTLEFFLQEAERDVNTSFFVDGFVDAFKNNRTKVISEAVPSEPDLEEIGFPGVSGGIIRLNAGKNIGDWTYTFKTESQIEGLQLVMPVSLPHFTPIIVDQGLGTYEVNGNLEGIFKIGHNLLVADEVQQIDGSDLVFAKDNAGIVELPITNVVFGTSTTIITVTPNGADLDLGIPTNEFADRLRIAPYKITVRSGATDGLTTMDTLQIKSIGVIDQVTIPADSTLELIASTGVASVLNSASKQSPNLKYSIFMREEVGSVARFGFSDDFQQTWTEFATTKTINISGSGQGDVERFNETQIAVADNGEAIWSYSFFDGARWTVKAVFAKLDDLAGFPFTDIPDIFGSGVGFIEQAGAFSTFSQLSADLTDLSYISVLLKRDNSNYNLKSIKNLFSGSPLNDINTTFSTTSASPSTRAGAIDVDGTGDGNRRIFIAWLDTSDNMHFDFYSEGSGSTTNIHTTSGGVRSGPLASAVIGDNWVVPVVGAGNNAFLYSFNDLTTIPAIVNNNQQMSAVQTPNAINWEASSVFVNALRSMDSRIIGGNIGANHVLITLDMTGPVGAVHNQTWEAQDIQAPVGIQTSFNVANSTASIRQDTGLHVERGFIQTGLSGSTQNCFAVRVYQNGNIAPGKKFRYRTENTTANLPNGVIIESAINEIEASEIPKDTNGTWVYFNHAPFVAGTEFAHILSGDWDLNNTDYIVVISDSGGGYAPGTDAEFDGSTWSSGTSQDWNFESNAFWLHDLGNTIRASDSIANQVQANQSATFGKIDTNQFQFAVGRTKSLNGATTSLPGTGHVYRRVLTASNTVDVPSTFTPAAIASYGTGEYDENLALSINFGSASAAIKNRTTGALEFNFDTLQDRSGWNTTGGHSISADHRITDTDMFDDVAYDFNGSTHFATYVNNKIYTDLSGKKFGAEFGVKFDNFLGVIIGTFDNTVPTESDRGWMIEARSDGAMSFIYKHSGAGTREVRTPTGENVLGTYARWRFVSDGTSGTWFKSTSKTTPFVQLAAGAVNDSTADISDSNRTVTIGKRVDPSQFLDAKLDYVKWMKGNDVFAYDGPKNQAAAGSPMHNLGLSIMVEQHIGLNQLTQSANGNFGQLAFLRQDKSRVDNKICQMVYEKTSLTNQGTIKGSDVGLEVKMERQSNENQFRAEGLIAKWIAKSI